MTEDNFAQVPLLSALPANILHELAAFLSGEPKPPISENFSEEIYLSKEKRVLLLIHFSLVVDALCFWMQQPVLPFLSETLGAHGTGYGILQSFVSFFALIGSPIFGLYMDKFGPKLAILISQMCSALMYLLVSVSFSLPILYLSRVLAIGQHAMLCCQAALSLITSEKNRSEAMGKLGFSCAIGMIAGGPLGGFICNWFGFRFAAFLSAAISAAMVSFNYLYLPELKSEVRMMESAEDSNEVEGLDFNKIVKMMHKKELRDILIACSLVSLGLSSFNTGFAVAAATVYKFTPQMFGFYMSFLAIVDMLTSVFLVKMIHEAFDNNYQHLMLFICSVLTFTFILLPQVQSIPGLMLLSVPVAASIQLMYVLSNSLISLSVAKDDQGVAISLGHSSRSFIRMLSPLVGGIIYDFAGISGSASTVVACSVLTATFCVTIAEKTFETVTSKSQQYMR